MRKYKVDAIEAWGTFGCENVVAVGPRSGGKDEDIQTLGQQWGTGPNLGHFSLTSSQCSIGKEKEIGEGEAEDEKYI